MDIRKKIGHFFRDQVDQGTPFGKIIKKTFSDALTTDIIDGLLLGIPSSMLMSSITHDYDVTIADAQKLYRAALTEYNQLSTKLNSESALRDALMEASQSTGPFGQIRQNLQEKYSNADASYRNAEKQLAEASNKLDLANSKIDVLRQEREVEVGSIGRAANTYFEHRDQFGPNN